MSPPLPSSKKPLSLWDIGIKAEKDFKIPTGLLRGLGMEESSGFNHWDENGNIIKSNTGATGGLQFTKGTAREMGINRDDPIENVLGGAKYLRQNYEALKGKVHDDTERWMAAAVAHNRGLGAVEGMIKDGRFEPTGHDAGNGGNTRMYATKIANNWAKLRDESPSNDTSDDTPDTTPEPSQISVGAPSAVPGPSPSDVAQYEAKFGKIPAPAAPVSVPAPAPSPSATPSIDQPPPATDPIDQLTAIGEAAKAGVRYDTPQDLEVKNQQAAADAAFLQRNPKYAEFLHTKNLTHSPEAVDQYNQEISKVGAAPIQTPDINPLLSNPEGEQKSVVLVVRHKDNPDGTTTNFLSDGTQSIVRYTKNADGGLTPVEVENQNPVAKTAATTASGTNADLEAENTYRKSQGQEPLTAAQFAANPGGKVDVSIDPGDFKSDGQKLTDFTVAKPTDDGGEVMFPREVGKQTDNPNGIAGQYRPAKGLSEEEEFRRAALNIGGKYNIDPQKVNEFIAQNRGHLFDQNTPGTGALINVPWKILQQMGVDPAEQRMEQVQNRLSPEVPGGEATKPFIPEQDAEAALEKRIKEPGYRFQQIASDAVAGALNMASNPIGQIYNDATKGFVDSRNTDEYTTAEKDRLLKQYGSYGEALDAENEYQAMNTPETVGRMMKQTGQSYLKNLVSGTGKGIVFMSNMLEKALPAVDPIFGQYIKDFGPTKQIGNALDFGLRLMTAPDFDTAYKGYLKTKAESDEGVDKQPLFKMWNAFDDAVGEDRVLKGRFLGAMSDSVGSMAAFMTLGVLTPELSSTVKLGKFSTEFGWAPAIFGGISQAGTGYEQGKQEGLTEKQAQMYGIIQTIGGMTEGFGAGGEVGRLIKNPEIRKNLARSLVSVGKEFIHGGGEEFVQEVTQDVWGNVALNALKREDPTAYDKVINTLKDIPTQFAQVVPNEGLLAFLSAGAFGGAGKAVQLHSSETLKLDHAGKEYDIPKGLYADFVTITQKEDALQKRLEELGPPPKPTAPTKTDALLKSTGDQAGPSEEQKAYYKEIGEISNEYLANDKDRRALEDKAKVELGLATDAQLGLKATFQSSEGKDVTRTVKEPQAGAVDAEKADLTAPVKTSEGTFEPPSEPAKPVVSKADKEAAIKKSSEEVEKESQAQAVEKPDVPVKVDENEPDVKQSSVKDARGLAQQLAPKDARTLKQPMQDDVYNYTNPDGIEVSLKDDAEGGYVNGEQVQGDVMIDVLANPTSMNQRGKGLASKEFNRILAEADKHDLSLSGIIDPETATQGVPGETVGMTTDQLRTWYKTKGFLVDPNGRYIYRPARTENATNLIRPEYQAKLNEIQPGKNLEDYSDVESLREDFHQGKLKEGEFYTDGDEGLFTLHEGKLKQVTNYRYDYHWEKDGKGGTRLVENIVSTDTSPKPEVKEPIKPTTTAERYEARKVNKLAFGKRGVADNSTSDEGAKEATGKELWQMTGAELLERRDAVRRGEASKIEPWDATRDAITEYRRLATIEESGKHAWDKMAANNAGLQHKRVVEKALADGKTVPAEVLADYPDLAPSTTETRYAAAKSVKAGSEVAGKVAGAQKVITERGTEATVKPRVIDASDIVTSLEPGYPSELQPRDRDRAASRAQISDIANRLDPEQLSDSRKASDGRPLVVPMEIDGKTKYVAISGNGRTAAIKHAYSLDNAPSKAYREFTQTKESHDLKEPVYVGVLDPKEIDLQTFSREANESATAKMSATEQAKVDAEKITTDTMGLFVPSEDGSIHSAANRDFVRSFLHHAVAKSDHGSLVDENGALSQEGQTRIRNAIFAKVYGEKAVKRLAESADNNVKRATTALLKVAPKFAMLNDMVASGSRQPGLAISHDVSTAMEKFAQLREKDTDVQTYIRQQGLFGDELTPLQKRILVEFDNYKNSSAALSGILNNYIVLANALGDPNQSQMFGEPVSANSATVFERAVVEYSHGKEADTTQASLFDSDKRGDTEPQTPRTPEKDRPESAESDIIQSVAKAPPVGSDAFKKWFGDSKAVDDSGNPLVLYHGTTHDFDTFDPSKANIENHFGKGIYLTDSPTDVSENYAGEGPDLTNRIEQRAERLLDDDEKYYEYGTPAYKKAYAKALAAAKREIAGSHAGVTMPLYAKIENPINLTEDNPTRYDALEQYDEEADEYTENPDSLPMKLYDGLQDIENSGDYNDFAAQRIWSDVNEAIDSDWDGVPASKVDEALRLSEGLSYATDDEGNLASHDILGTLYADALGFDGIIMDADKAFGSKRAIGKQMAMDEGTKHYVVFQPEQVKSAIGNRGTFDPGDPNILHKLKTAESYSYLTEKLPTMTGDELMDLPADPLDAGKLNDDKTELEISERAAEVLRKIQASISGQDVKAFEGALWRPSSFSVMVPELRSAHEAAIEAGHSEESAKWLNDLANNLDDLAEFSKRHGIVYVFQDSLEEERHHREDALAGSTDEAARTTLDDSPFLTAPKFVEDYGNYSRKDKMAEVFAKLATGQEAYYGFDKVPGFEDAKQHFLATYADGIIRNNGIETLSQFEAFAEKYRRISVYGSFAESIKKAGENNNGEAEGNERDAERGQEKGRAPPASEGESETSQAPGESAEIPDEGKLKQSKIGKSVERKAIESGLSDGFDKTAEYAGIVNKDEIGKAVDLMAKDFEGSRAMIRGEKRVPDGVAPEALLIAMEKHAELAGDPDLLYEVSNSPITSESSIHAQKLQLFRERDPDSVAARVQDVRRARVAGIKKLLNGRTVEQALADEAAKIEKHVKAAKKTPIAKKTWNDFVDSLEC